jgi:UDP-N-acetylglucosamine--N-acetylmuramyl-(pentapeptide) pyrophosphoryl-undecaprenol N-acetylglucosamine transferase
MTRKFIIAGGGTGGHIFPAIAIAQRLEKMLPASDILFVGAKGKMEMEKVPQAGYKIIGLDIAGFNRSALWKNIGLPIKILRSFFQSRSIIRKYKPDAVIGVGGYSTFPVLKAAQAAGIPTFIHEANSYAGKSNKLLAKKAVKIFTGTDSMEKFFPAEKIIVTGNPVRSSIFSEVCTKDDALKFFGLEHTKQTILIIGGSLGASSINHAIAKGLDKLLDANLQVIWQTGKLFKEEAFSVVRNKTGVWVGDFITEMGKAYAAADMVISRSGAMSVAEISLVGKPVVFIPYPYAAEDHQTVNAQHLVNRNAALMIPNQEASVRLIDTVIRLSNDKQLQDNLKTNIKHFAIQDADVQVANQIIETLNK